MSRKNKKSKRYTFKIAIGILIVGVFTLCGVYYFISQTKKEKQFVYSPSYSYVTPTSFATPTPSEPTGPVHQYVSENLGISFTYPSTSWKITPHEIGSKIFFLQGETGDGDDIEVIHLSFPANTIKQAIEEQFLTGISPKDCFVVTNYNNNLNAPDSFEEAIISYPGDYGQDNVPSEYFKCPPHYTHTNVSYFIMDPKHPSTLIYINEGQQPLAGVGPMITTTIKVLH